MRRHRFSSLLLILFGIAASFYLMASLYLPSARRLLFGVDKSNGQVRMVNQDVTFLPWHRFYRLDFPKSDGAAQTAGIIRINSREGVPLKMTFRLRFSIAGDRLPDVRHLVREGWGGWLRRRVSEAVSAVSAQTPVEEFASPLYDYGVRRARLRETVARHLARSGVNVTAFEIEQLEIDQEALLEFKRAELRRKARGNYSRVAVFAIDGADWELISELVVDGRLPNLRALMAGGTSGAVQTVQPTVSPLVWTTVATGLPPDRHGILEFFDRRAGNAPVTANSRLVPAIWEISEAFGRPATVVNWWTEWPPSTSGNFDSMPLHSTEKAVYPLTLQPLVRNAMVPEQTLGYRHVARFLNITETEYNEAVTSGNPTDPVVVFRGVLAKSWSDHRSAIELYRATRPTLFMMSYEGTDFVNHLFGPYHPPYREGVSNVGFRRYWPAVANYYSEIDRLLGEWMQILPSDTTVMVVSGHGMRWGSERPKAPPSGTSALSAHRNAGVFIAYGNNVVPSRVRRPLSVYDIAPTILTLIGLPKSKEMPGNYVSWAFQNVQPVTGVNIASYQDLIGRKFVPTEATADQRTYRARLSAIGHITDPNRVAMPVAQGEQPLSPAEPLSREKWGTYAFFNNQAITLKRQDKFNDAVRSLQAAISLNPRRPVPYVNLAILLMQKQRYSDAEELFLRAVELGLPNPEKYFLDFAAWYRQHDMPTRAVNLLLEAREMFPQSWLIAANLGSAYAATQRYTDAMAEFDRALGMNPSSTLVLNNLGTLYAKKEDYGRAVDYWNRSLAIDPKQQTVRESVNAARTRL